MTIVEMCVHMDCDGCEKKIRRALMKLKGIDNIDINMVTQKVTVTGWVDQKKVLKTVRKTGRRAVLWPYPDNAEYQYYYYEHQPVATTVAGYAHNHPAIASASSSYNYRKHGYNDLSVHEYYGRPDYSTSIIDEKASNMFSDENTSACSIM
ncbi:putative heavy metal-associated domain, HMA, heavy metal-associated domain superfamily [Dioscorea sansibarensis]